MTCQFCLRTKNVHVPYVTYVPFVLEILLCYTGPTYPTRSHFGVPYVHYMPQIFAFFWNISIFAENWVVSSLPSKNQFLTIVVKTSEKANVKVFLSSLVVILSLVAGHRKNLDRQDIKCTSKFWRVGILGHLGHGQ